MPAAPLLAVNESSGEVVCEVPACGNCSSATPTDEYPMETPTGTPKMDEGRGAGGVQGRGCCGVDVSLTLQVSTNGRDWASGHPDGTPISFTYYEKPKVSALGALPAGAPLSGPPLGGISLTVRGSGFLASRDATGRAACRFGHSVVAAMHVSDLGLLCVSMSRCGSNPRRLASAAAHLVFEPHCGQARLTQ